MAKLTVKGSNVHDILISLNRHQQEPMIGISFRQDTKDFNLSKMLLPGLSIAVSGQLGKHLSRDCSTLEEAIQYIRKLYRDTHAKDRTTL